MKENMGQPYIVFLTGASGVGKTTAYKALREDNTVIARDIDEDGVPPAGDGPWRQFRVELLLYEALKSYKAGASTVICGMTFPHEVTWSTSFDSNLNLWIIALTASPEQLRVRLQKRTESDERFSADKIERIIQNNIDLQPRLVHAVRVLSRGLVLDASDLNADETLREIRAIISTYAVGASLP